MNAAAAAWVTAYVALGSNLQQPQRQLHSGFAALAGLPQTQAVAQSSLYRSAAVGYAAQPDFVNAVAALRTLLGARALLDALLALERVHGRVREVPNGPRTLDLDLVLYGEQVINEPGLTVPHPRMLERAFVLAPLAEIAPDALVPGRGRVRELLANVDVASVTLLREAAA